MQIMKRFIQELANDFLQSYLSNYGS